VQFHFRSGVKQTYPVWSLGKDPTPSQQGWSRTASKLLRGGKAPRGGALKSISSELSEHVGQSGSSLLHRCLNASFVLRTLRHGDEVSVIG
jgi:hypothetical protein